MRRTNPIARVATAAALLAAAIPALAGPPHWAPAYGHRHAVQGPRFVRVMPMTYVAPLPRAAVVYAAPVYYAPAAPVYYAPAAPAYYAYPAYGVNGAVAGALAGAVIGGAVTHGDQRVAGVAVGSVLGAVIGNEIARGY